VPEFVKPSIHVKEKQDPIFINITGDGKPLPVVGNKSIILILEDGTTTSEADKLRELMDDLVSKVSVQ
jgi:hypothetical protein